MRSPQTQHADCQPALRCWCWWGELDLTGEPCLSDCSQRCSVAGRYRAAAGPAVAPSHHCRLGASSLQHCLQSLLPGVQSGNQTKLYRFYIAKQISLTAVSTDWRGPQYCSIIMQCEARWWSQLETKPATDFCFSANYSNDHFKINFVLQKYISELIWVQNTGKVL